MLNMSDKQFGQRLLYLLLTNEARLVMKQADPVEQMSFDQIDDGLVGWLLFL